MRLCQKAQGNLLKLLDQDTLANISKPKAKFFAMAGDTICVLVPVYERGDSSKHKVYDTFKSQTYQKKKLLVCRNGVRNEAVDEFWRNVILYAIDDDDEPAAKLHSSASRISDEARCATEQTPDTYDSTGLPVDLPAEFLEDSANAAAQLAAEKASFTASLVELKRLASDMGEKYHAQMLEAPQVKRCTSNRASRSTYLKHPPGRRLL